MPRPSAAVVVRRIPSGLSTSRKLDGPLVNFPVARHSTGTYGERSRVSFLAYCSLIALSLGLFGNGVYG